MSLQIVFFMQSNNPRCTFDDHDVCVRSVKIGFISARCPLWLYEDFVRTCLILEGETMSVVLRRLARNYVDANRHRVQDLSERC